MYLSHYGLKLKPFQITVDPRFLWLSEKHKEALAALKYGIVENKGFVLLTGEVGTGKTLLIKRLEEILDIDTLSAAVPYPELTTIDFFKLLGISFGFKNPFRTKAEFLIQLKEFLLSAYRKDKQVLLIVDESQLLSYRLLEEIRLLSNIELHDRKLINILFVGQSEFLDVLSEERNRAVAQRIAIRFNLEPLSEKEVAEFIAHRLDIAGSSKKIFSSSAIHEVYEFSTGIPRLINVICDHALLTGYAQDKKRIDDKIIRECAQELRIPVRNKQDEMRLRQKADEIKHEIISKIQNQKGKNHGESYGGDEFELPPFPDIDIPKREETASFSDPNPEPVMESSIEEIPYEPLTEDEAEPYINFTDHSDASHPLPPPETTMEQDVDIDTDIHIQKKKIISLSFLSACLAAILIVGFGLIFLGFQDDDSSNWSPPSEFPSQNAEDFEETQTKRDDGALPNETGGSLKQPSKKEDSSQNKRVPPKKEAPVSTALSDESGNSESYPSKITVYFELNSNDISADGIRSLDWFVEKVKLSADQKIYVKGYTDSKGPRSYNVSVSQFRANIVKSYLTGKGISSSRIETLGFGAEDPIASNETLDGRRLNRRVEVEAVSENPVESDLIE